MYDLTWFQADRELVCAASGIKRGHTLLFTAKNASVLATTIAALDDTPDPGGTDPVTSRSTGTGFVSLVGK